MSDNKGPKPIVETPSATTSEDNTNSGSFAYVITGVALAFVIVASLAGAGCVAFALNLAADAGSYGNGYSDTSTPMTFNDYDDMDFNEWLERYERDLQGYGTNGTSDNGRTTGEASVRDALDFSLAPYNTTIDGELSANAYAGAPAALRDYARALVNADKDHTTTVVGLLNQAARNNDERSAKIKEAVAACGEARTALANVAIPEVESAEVRDLLSSASTNAQNRWQHMEAELSLLDTQDSVDTEQLWREDDQVVQATETAADALRDAMEMSANR